MIVSLGPALATNRPPGDWIFRSTPNRFKRKDHPTGGLFFWSRIRESNPPSRLGKPLYYRYTNPALCGYYSKATWKIQHLFVGREYIHLPFSFRNFALNFFRFCAVFFCKKWQDFVVSLKNLPYNGINANLGFLSPSPGDSNHYLKEKCICRPI